MHRQSHDYCDPTEVSGPAWAWAPKGCNFKNVFLGSGGKMMVKLKQPRFEYLSNEFYQGSHTFQQTALWALQWAWGGGTHVGSGV